MLSSKKGASLLEEVILRGYRDFWHAELVLLASAWTEYSTSQMDDLLAAVEAQTDAPVLIVGRKHFGRMDLDVLLGYSDDEFLAARQENPSHLELIAQVPEEVRANYLDLHRILCGDQNSCPISTPEGYLISYDGGHLTREGAIHLADLLAADDDFSKLWTTTVDSLS